MRYEDRTMRRRTADHRPLTTGHRPLTTGHWPLTTLVLVAALCVVAFACSKPPAIRNATVDQLHAALATPETLVLDVRELTETGANPPLAAGSLQIPLSMLPADLVTVPKDRAIYVLADDARAENTALGLLVDAGYKKVFRVQGGAPAYAKKYHQE